MNKGIRKPSIENYNNMVDGSRQKSDQKRRLVSCGILKGD